MTKIIKWEITEGENAGYIATTIPAIQMDLAQTNPEVANMTEDEYIQFIIDKDIMPNHPKNIQIMDAT